MLIQTPDGGICQAKFGRIDEESGPNVGKTKWQHG